MAVQMTKIQTKKGGPLAVVAAGGGARPVGWAGAILFCSVGTGAHCV